MSRQLSDTPDAIRQKKYRERKAIEAAELFARVRAQTGQGPAASAAPPTLTSVPLHETEVLDAPAPDAFMAPAFLPVDEDAGDAKGEPFIPPPAPDELPPLTREEVAPIAMAVAKYFEMGSTLALIRNAQKLGQAGIDVRVVAEQMPIAKAFVQTSAENVCMKYRIRLPYQDEIVVAGALGLATYGFFGGDKKEEDAGERASSPRAPANANVQAPPATTRSDVTSGPPPDAGDAQERDS